MTVYRDPQRSVAVPTGGEFVIELPANPSTGYSWNLSFGPERLELLERTPHSSGARPGAGGTESFRFRARQAGFVEVEFTLGRSWTPEAAPADRKVFQVIIGGE